MSASRAGTRSTWIRVDHDEIDNINDCIDRFEFALPAVYTGLDADVLNEKLGERQWLWLYRSTPEWEEHSGVGLAAGFNKREKFKGSSGRLEFLLSVGFDDEVTDDNIDDLYGAFQDVCRDFASIQQGSRDKLFIGRRPLILTPTWEATRVKTLVERGINEKWLAKNEKDRSEPPYRNPETGELVWPRLYMRKINIDPKEA